MSNQAMWARTNGKQEMGEHRRCWHTFMYSRPGGLSKVQHTISKTTQAVAGSRTRRGQS